MDGDGDADVDGADYLVWQRQVASDASDAAAAAKSSSAVPEPSAEILRVAATVAVALAVRGRRLAIR